MDERWVVVRFSGLYAEEVTEATRFSPALQRLRPVHLNVYADRVILEFHGGHEHYGYELERDAKSDEWVLSWYLDNKVEPLLTRSQMASARPMPGASSTDPLISWISAVMPLRDKKLRVSSG